MKKGMVKSVSKSPTHTMSKAVKDSILLIKGLGIEGDAHLGKKVKHRSRVARDPNQPNLRQIHLIHDELHQELLKKGFKLIPGQMGENITITGIDLLALPQNTILRIGEKSRVKITGLRSPCHQLEGIQAGLMKAVLGRDEEGNLIRKAGIMGIVEEGGIVTIGDTIQVVLPSLPHKKLEKV